jgi:hypothetical protein
MLVLRILLTSTWANALISASVPGSWAPNWLQGNPNTVNLSELI